MIGHFLTIASEHNGTSYSQLLQTSNSLGSVILDLIVDNDMACIFAIDSHMDNGTHMMAIMPLRTNSIHHLRIAHTDNALLTRVSHADLGTDAMTCDLLDIRDLTAIRRLIWEGITQGSANG